MDSTFKVTAKPGLLLEGEFAGHLETVHFVADDASETVKWWTVNTGTLERDFSRIVSAELAAHLVSELRAGRPVELPNRYFLGEIRGVFETR